ncbi:hypothetical protein HLB35_11000 [Halomonas sp. TBZ9]|uniref:Uncharacterized protein n=1 Tax=Vreelandella azerica TaxID=2732867 RepID=A0A7Y3TXP3_9GAMM|nr:hypothetical protein [Halomonas azerica]NOG32151.1 hypothetical protein [Halomonas azerica]
MTICFFGHEVAYVGRSFFDESLAGIDFSHTENKKSRDEIEDVAFITIDDLDEECADKALFRYKVIKLVNKKLNGGWTKKNIEPIIYELYNEGVIDKKPGWQSVARWNAKYRAGKDLLSLVDVRAIKNNFCDFESFSKDTFLGRNRKEISYKSEGVCCDHLSILQGFNNSP